MRQAPARFIKVGRAFEGQRAWILLVGRHDDQDQVLNVYAEPYRLLGAGPPDSAGRDKPPCCDESTDLPPVLGAAVTEFVERAATVRRTRRQPASLRVRGAAAGQGHGQELRSSLLTVGSRRKVAKSSGTWALRCHVLSQTPVCFAYRIRPIGRLCSQARTGRRWCRSGWSARVSDCGEVMSGRIDVRADVITAREGRPWCARRHPRSLVRAFAGPPRVRSGRSCEHLPVAPGRTG
jgi:hypothetical protein